MSLQSLLNRSISLRRPIVTKDRSKGSVKSYQLVENAVDIPARIEPLSVEDRVAFGQRMLYVTHKIYLDTDIAVRRGDHILSDQSQQFILRGYRKAAGDGRLFVIECKEQT